MLSVDIEILFHAGVLEAEKEITFAVDGNVKVVGAHFFIILPVRI